MNASLMLIKAIVHGYFAMNTEVPDFTSHFHHTCTMSPYAEIRVVAHRAPAMNSEVPILPVISTMHFHSVSEIIGLLHSHSQRFFANVSLKFLNINNRPVTSAHVAILLSLMQLIEEYLLATKRF